MSFRPVRKIEGIGTVYAGAEVLDIAEYELEIYEEDPDSHEHHAGNPKAGALRIEGTVQGTLPIRQDLRLLTEEGYSMNFFLRDSFGTVVAAGPMVDDSGAPVR
jgi:hypothetical protein